MLIAKALVLFAGLALAGCAQTGSTTSPNGDATSGNAQNVFNIHLNVDTPYGQTAASQPTSSDGSNQVGVPYRVVSAVQRKSLSNSRRFQRPIR